MVDPRRLTTLWASTACYTVIFTFFTHTRAWEDAGLIIRQASENKTVILYSHPTGRSSSPVRVKNFLFSKFSRPDLGSTQPPIQWVPGALSHEVKRQGREAEHSPLAIADVKKMWIYTSTPPYTFMAQCLIRWAQVQLYLSIVPQLEHKSLAVQWWISALLSLPLRVIYCSICRGWRTDFLTLNQPHAGL
jgi:hypothetical protein